MGSERSRVTGLTFCTSLFALVLVLLFASLVRSLLPEWSWQHLAASFLFFDRFILDFLVFLLVAAPLISGGVIRRILGYLWCLVFFSAYLAQLNAVYVGGEFLTFLAVDNISHVSLLVNPRSIAAALFLAAFFGWFVFLLERRYQRSNGWVGVTVYCAIVLVLAIAVHQHRSWVPGEIADLRDSYYSSRDNRLAHRSPVESLYKVLFREQRGALKPLSSEDVERASQQFGISLNPGRRYPLVKERIYGEPLPFKMVSVERSQPNVIVFMVEGLSARTLDMYDSLYPGLTPNMKEFSRRGMVVHDYYNHTYATYRGLLGQFCSIYPTHGGLGGWHDRFESVKRINYLCLPDLLNDAGYHTVFLDTHRRDAGYVDEMMAQIGFSEVLTAEPMVESYALGDPLRSDALSDHQLMRGLVAKLETLAGNKERQPFFLSLYNLETHAFQRIRKDGKSFEGRESYVLDSIHNFDHAFGQFWEYFQQFSLAENTIVVLTSDHTHYPDRDFVAIMDGDEEYRPYFVDRIPLVIFDPTRTLPPEFNANNASSTAFAPTMAQWLGLENGTNPFVGKSLFDSTVPNAPSSIASADFEHFLISSSGVEMKGREGQASTELEFAAYIVETIRELEQHDRVWPAE